MEEQSPAAAATSARALALSATVAFSEGDYERAAATFELYLRNHQVVLNSEAHAGRLDVLYGYADALAASGRLQASLEVFAHISRRLAGYAVPLEKLHHISVALVTSVIGAGRRKTGPAQPMAAPAAEANALATPTPAPASVDPLCCAICGDVLRSPMTALCGHTFCGECLLGGQQQHCCLCGMAFKQCKPDVLVQRLVEKWWSPEENKRAAGQLEQSAMAEALRSCNESLDKCPNNFQGLLLRSEVLYWLNYFQSSLADADNALRSRPTSHKAHERRAYALAALGLVEEALIAQCASVTHNREASTHSSSATMQEVAKLIQRLIVPQVDLVRKSMSTASPFPAPPAPYTVEASAQRRRLRRQRNVPMPIGTSSTDAAATEKADRMHETLLATAAALFHTEPDQPLVVGAAHAIGTAADPADAALMVDQLGETPHHFLPHRRKSARICNGRRRTRSEQLQQPADSNTTTAQKLSCIPRPNSRFKHLLDRIQLESDSSRTQIARVQQQLNVHAALVDVSDFECVLCYRTLWKPVVTPCGHTYCLVCLDRCLDYSTHCPLCKFSFATDDYSMQCVRSTLARQYVTRFIETAMQRFVPDAYRKRQRQEIEREPFVPIFVCTTAFPYVSCPLFVYEARYRLMIRRAIDGGDRQFGIVQSANGSGSGAVNGTAAAVAATTNTTTTNTANADEHHHHHNKNYSDFGTMLSIRDCVLMANGRSILSTVGGRRFRVMKRGERDGYSTAKVQYIYDEPVRKGRLQHVSDLHANVFLKAVIWYNSLPESTKEEIVKSFGAMPLLEGSWETVPDGPAWAWYIIALLPLGQPLKVEILASTSLEKRLLAINKTLDYVAAQKQRRSVCLQSCAGVQPCQAIDCCQQRATSSGQNGQDNGTVVGGVGGGVGGGGRNDLVNSGAVRTTDIIIVEDDDDINAMNAALS